MGACDVPATGPLHWAEVYEKSNQLKRKNPSKIRFHNLIGDLVSLYDQIVNVKGKDGKRMKK
jgi:hypothetical protein